MAFTAAREPWVSASSKGKTDGLTNPLEGLRKVLALEGNKKYSNAAVVGGLDLYLQRFVADNQLPPSHPVVQILEGLPHGGYRDLHPITRKRVVDQLLRAAGRAPRSAVIKPPSRAPADSRSQPAPRTGGRQGNTSLSAPPRASAKRAAPGAPARQPSIVIGTPESAVSALTGISRAVESRLSKLEIRTVRDLLYHIPVRYHDYSEVRPIAELQIDEEQTVIGDVWSVSATTPEPFASSGGPATGWREDSARG